MSRVGDICAGDWRWHDGVGGIDWGACRRTYERGLALAPANTRCTGQGGHACQHRRNKRLQRCGRWQRALAHRLAHTRHALIVRQTSGTATAPFAGRIGLIARPGLPTNSLVHVTTHHIPRSAAAGSRARDPLAVVATMPLAALDSKSQASWVQKLR